MSTQKVKRRVSWNIKEYEQAEMFLLIYFEVCYIQYSFKLLFVFFYIEKGLTTTGVVALAIILTLLGIALLTIFFLLRHFLTNQTNRQHSDIPLSQNKESSQTFTDMSTTEDVSVYTTLMQGRKSHLMKC